MKLRTLLLAGAVTAATILPSSALSLKVNGRDRTAEARTALIENTTYVSLRSVAAMLDGSAQVEWTGGQAVVNTKKASLTARPGDEYIQVNGRYIYVKNGVRAAHGSVLVALRPLAAAPRRVRRHPSSIRSRLRQGRRRNAAHAARRRYAS